MGRAARWFKGIFGGTTRKEKEKDRDGNSSCSPAGSVSGDKRRWSIGRSGKDDRAAVKPQGSRPGAEADPGWIRSYTMDTEKERSRHAIAVAAATTAAADAAVAAAHAAAAVVRLTSQGGGAMFMGGGHERWAAARIQAVFRGYLARKALRALKGLVKLQALVRGYLVRKRAAATLHSMQALIRAQTAARSRRARCSVNKENKMRAENWRRRSIERFEDCCSDFHSERISTSYDPPPSVANGFEESPKIVEIDTYKPRTRSRRMSGNVLVERGDDYYPHHAVSSPLPFPVPARLSIPESRYQHDPEWWFVGDEWKFPTAHNTPRFAASGRRHQVPGTPARSVCGDAVFRGYHPNYMANTKSFDAKVRSQSAPKQRPEEAGFKKRLSLNEMMASRMSVSGVRMQRSAFQHPTGEE